MIIGIGTDIVKTERFKNQLGNQKFMDKIFTPAEQEYIKNTQSAAAVFAAKEAFYKACGCRLKISSFMDAQVLHQKNGAPYFDFLNTAKDKIKKENITVLLSLSHEKEYAIAYAVACKNL